MAEIAHILSVGNGVAEVAGFTDLRADELLTFAGGVMGIASNLSEDRAASSFWARPSACAPATRCAARAGWSMCRWARALIGRVVDGLGRPLDGGAHRGEEFLPIEQPAPPIMHRAPVQVPLQTGIKAVDAAIPIGRGQRELILGDRQTGKTAIAVDAILNQRDTGVLSIYCAIGQRASAVARVIQSLREGGAMERTIVVVASGEDAPGLQFVAPYAATSMAEHFMARGATC
jgi:F-type H+/Na+-transporting ATPase subunit alpha